MALFTTSWLSGFTWASLTEQSGTGVVQRELAALLDAGLLLMTKRGNQKHFQANPAAPIFAELRGLVLKTMGLADALLSFMARWPNSKTGHKAILTC